MPDARPNLYDLDLPALETLLASWKEPRFRARQIWQWLYQHLATDWSQMTSLPVKLRTHLALDTRLDVPAVLASQESIDGETRKDLLEMTDGEQIEVVLMRYLERRSACISTQAGCAAGCGFCATGQMGFRRNLTSGEIVTQALHMARELRRQEERLTHVVLMGMGEPLLNYDATVAALRRLTDPEGFALGQRHITVSTCGIAPAIRQLAGEGLQVTLAVSLHAATDAVRSQIMPINQRYGLEELMAAVADYLAQTNRRVTFEWTLIENVNDTHEQAEALAARLKGMLAHVNLIPLNPTEEFSGRPPSTERIKAFTDVLDRKHIAYTLRLGRGADIRAGCGQLRRRNITPTQPTES